MESNIRSSTSTSPFYQILLEFVRLLRSSRFHHRHRIIDEELHLHRNFRYHEISLGARFPHRKNSNLECKFTEAYVIHLSFL